MDAATIRLATVDDAPAIREIYGHYIDKPVTFEEELPSEEDFTARVQGILQAHPYLVVEQKSQVIGYAYAHELTERAAYRWNVELSIYLAPRAGRKGIGTTLYRALLALLKLQGARKAYARVTLPNAASKRLHVKLHFKEEWVQKRAGWKNDRWYDVAWYSKQLLPQTEKAGQTPDSPTPFPQVDPESVAQIIVEANAELARAAKKPIVSATTRKCMQGNRSTNTKPEQIVRQMLRDLGYPGYRLQWKSAPGRPDIAYPGRKVAIFVNGCFWHRCPVCNLPTPQSNVEFWEAKFARNVARDERNRTALEDDGWTVVTVWEHDLTPDRREATSRYLYEIVSLSDSCETN